MDYSMYGLGLAICGAHGSARAASACENLKQLRLPNTVITIAQSHAGGTEQFELRGAPGIPGMGHCGGGIGPAWIAGAAVAADAEHDVVRAHPLGGGWRGAGSDHRLGIRQRRQQPDGGAGRGHRGQEYASGVRVSARGAVQRAGKYQ